MLLKRIEAIGFKSFADRTVIEFPEGITAVVGPNGSGKSNIADAIKWVLGEQSSKSLRGDTMSDVIFNGTSMRPPLNVAEVTIVLDNSDHTLPIDYEEVSLTRRIYRSGESTYYINKQKVRLKDIRDLILDTGVGADSLSIISQDNIRAVIESNNEERRAIIEEAAGVLKYKNRKKETVRNLENTDYNLERAKDILVELKSQYENLEKQSAAAREYLEVKGQLEKIEVALYVRDIEQALKRMNELEKLMQETQIQIQTYEQMHTINQHKLKQITEKQMKLNAEINFEQNRLIELTAQISNIEGQRKALVGNGEEASFEEVLKQNLSKLLSLEEDLSLRETKINELESEYARKKAELTSLQDKYYRKNSQKESTKVRIQYLNDFSNAYYGGVKNVLENPKLKGIEGTVDALIKAREEHVLAIEMALGGAMQHIVCETVEDAKEAIKYLKQGNLGRATFLPIEVMRPNFVDNRTLELVKKQKGFIDVAVNLIQFDEKYRNVMENLLGHVLICDNIDNATEIARKINSSFRIVTLDGEIIHVGGSITGGRQKVKEPGLLQQRIALEEANKELVKLENELKELANIIETKDKELQAIDHKLYNERFERLKLEETHRTQKAQIDRLKKALEDEEINELINRRDALMKHIENLRTEFYACYDNQQYLQQEISEITKFLKTMETQLREYEVEKNRLDVKYNNMLDFLSNEYHVPYDYAKANFNLEMDYEIAKIRVRNLRKHLESLGYVNLNAIDEFDQVKARYEKLKSNYEDLLKAKEDILSSIKELDEEMIRRFKETFEKVNVEFNKVFQELFGGGRAELILEDETDLLNTGIEIVAHPPGTRLNNAKLLSGGQKTLTAIALLFAVLRVKTLPFCILDECEAALDEANVYRYAEYLRKFSKQSQFIVITHRKTTMEQADVLYGVTMQEPGVSTLVSVRFEDTDKYIENYE